MTQPLVSIVTPSYNQGQFIAATIESVIAQDYPAIEHIILDGGSTDQTVDLLRRYTGTYDLYWHSAPDNGQADAIARGFRQTRGSILAWLNSDDIYLTRDVISSVVALFERYPQVDVITGSGVLIDAAGFWYQPARTTWNRTARKRLWVVDDMLQPATFFRAQVFERVAIDTTLHYAFDWDLFCQLVQQRYNLLAVPDAWAGYRVWGANKSFAREPQRARELWQVTGRYAGRLAWQYWAVGALCGLTYGVEQAPTGLRPTLRWLLSRGWLAIWYTVGGRIAL